MAAQDLEFGTRGLDRVFKTREFFLDVFAFEHVLRHFNPRTGGQMRIADGNPARNANSMQGKTHILETTVGRA